MITKSTFEKLLVEPPFDFTLSKGVYSRYYGTADEGFVLSYNSGTGEFLYPEGVIADRNTTQDDHQKESYVVFLCVAQLLKVGYLPKHLKLEGKNYSGTDKGYCDILIKDNEGKEYAIIECKTASFDKKDDEFTKHWNKTLKNGDQLFRYFNTYRAAKYLCLFAADYPEYTSGKDKIYKFEQVYHVISLVDNDNFLATDRKLRSFKNVRAEQGGFEEYFDVWKETYQQDFSTRGLLEDGIEPFKIGEKKYQLEDLKTIDEYSLQKKYNNFAEILRKHTISSHENAFDKLVNLFLSKIIDEKYNGNELTFQWKGASYDDVYSLQDRLNILYRQGMKEFFNDEVTYVENEQIENAFRFLTSQADEGKNTIRRYFRELKYFNNNPFAFLDVHNEQLFYQNAAILKDVIAMLQDIYLTKDADNQFLGDLFEGYLNQGVHQSEGQFFTPMPIVRFLISSLPLQQIIEQDNGIPKAIDYACGAGHFLTEYARQITPFIKGNKHASLKNYYENIEGIEKDYRLSKVSQVSAFMYGMDGIKIHYADGLSAIEHVEDHNYMVLVANPPYSVKGFLETLTEEERNKFVLTKAISDFSKNNSIETFFIERAAQLLKTNGVAAIILPSSILNKGGIYTKCREVILKYFDIISLVTFGDRTFGQTNTATVTLFLRRKNTETEIAKHLQYRVNEWFKGNFMDDTYYGDESAIRRYTEYIGINFDLYKQLMLGNMTEDLKAHSVIQSYNNALDAYSKQGRFDTKDLNEHAKLIRINIRKRVTDKSFKKLQPESREQEVNRALVDFCKAIEQEKLYYFLLAESNPQPVLVISSPTDKEKQKKFLGYEWSNRKGNEGIKYLNVKTTAKNEDGEEADDDTLQQIKGISSIQTPLFNPTNLDDEEKLSMLIRNNYTKTPGEVPQDLAPFVKAINLTDMIDFTRVATKKEFDTNGRKQIDSKYPLLALSSPQFSLSIGQRVLSSEIVIDGKYPVYSANVHTPFGQIDKLLINTFDVDSILWGIDGDWMVSYMPKETPFYPTDHCGVLRIVGDNILPYYCAMALKIVGEKYGFSRTYRASIDRMKDVRLPIPPKDIQQQIVDECQKIDQEYNTSRMSIDNYRQKIAQVFNNLQVINKMGGGKWLKMSELCEFNPSKSEANSLKDEQLISFVEMASVSNDGYIERMEDKSYSNVKRGGYTYFAENDIIIAKITPCMENGKCAIATGLTNGVGFGSTEFHVLRCKELLINKYLFGYLNRPNIREEAAKRMKGASGHRRVPIEFYEDLEIPVLPINEQQQIVDEIEKYKAEIIKAQAIMDSCVVRKKAILNKYLN